VPAEISVIIPVYNGAAYLAEAVESARAQTLAPRRIVLVDDGSTDATPEVAARLQADGRAPAVEYVRQANGGPAAALNRGVAMVADGYVAFLDADDVWLPDKLRLQLDALAGGADLAFGHVQNFISPELDPKVAATLQCPPDPMPAPIASTMLARVADFRRVGPLNEAIRIGEFLDWYGRATDLGLTVAMPPQVVARRRLHGANHSLSRGDNARDYTSVLKAMLDRRRRERPRS
jgi:glycosyltransferase involved in cell wall biosynthesis